MARRPTSTEARRPGEAAHQRGGAGAAPRHGGAAERADCSPRHSCAMAPVGPKGAPSTQRLRREQTQVKVASLLAPPLFPSPVPSVDLCGMWLLPSLLGRSGASMAGSRRSPREHPARPARSHERPPATQPPNDAALPRFHETLPACAPRLRCSCHLRRRWPRWRLSSESGSGGSLVSSLIYGTQGTQLTPPHFCWQVYRSIKSRFGRR